MPMLLSLTTYNTWQQEWWFAITWDTAFSQPVNYF
jgi:hypothetical protein